MWKILFYLIIAVFLGQCAPKNMKPSEYNNFDFNRAWEKVEQLEDKRLYKSANKIVIEIYKAARSLGNSPQKVKALFYRGKYSNFLEEDNLVHFEELFLKEIQTADFPERPVLQSILGEFYDRYLDAHIWKIQSRTALKDTTGRDMLTWPVERFIRESNKLFRASILDPRLRDISYKTYQEILTKAENTGKMRDNLYEILAYRTLNHFRNDRNYLPQMTSSFVLDDPELFAAPERFTGMKWSAPDEEDMKFNTLKLFREIEQHNLHSKDYEELVDVALKRLEWVKSQYVKPDKEELYLKALDALIEAYPGAKTTSEAWYAKALTLSRTAGEEAPKDRDLREAREICLKVEKKYPGTVGAALCMRLREGLEASSFGTSMEQVYIPGEHLLYRVDYKNIKQLSFTLIQLSKEQYLSQLKSDHRTDILEQGKELRSWTQILPEEDDLGSHSIELGLKPLQNGIYALRVHGTPIFKGAENIEKIYTIFHVSRLAYFIRDEEDSNLIYDEAGSQFIYIRDGGSHFISEAGGYGKFIVVDRKTGAPVQGAQVHLEQHDHRSGRLKIVKETTDVNGIASLDAIPDGNYQIKIFYGEDQLLFPAGLSSYHRKWNERPPREQAVFFTDRGLYRPGQTLYFKGLVIRRNENSIPSLVHNAKTVTVKLLDANHQMISEQCLTVNSFGSFNGSFVLPSSGLNGRMTLQTSDGMGGISFRVEEYKRPKFEVRFDKYKDTYRLGDTVELTGYTKAYTGFPIREAMVRYTVKRKVYYPYYYGAYFLRPGHFQRNLVEIAHGVTETDASGQFKIPVELYAGDLDLTNGIMHMTYQVHADVIDRTGETHSASAGLHAGTTEVLMEVDVKDIVMQGQPVEIALNATNYSGVDVPVQGDMHIESVVPPERILRSRYWEEPDTFLWDKATFKALFPSYSYKGELFPSNWEVKGELKYLPFHTGEKKKYNVDLPAGSYKIRISYQDPSGKKVDIIRFVSVYSREKNPPQKALWVEADRKTYTPPSEAHLHMQAQVPLHVYRTIWMSQKKLMQEQWVRPKPGIDQALKVLEEHRGGIGVLSDYIYDGRYYSLHTTLQVPWENKELKFEVERMESALKPGQEVQWTFKVKPLEGHTVPSELLASMYDKSLDAIYQHDWMKWIWYPPMTVILARFVGFRSANEVYYTQYDRRVKEHPIPRKSYRDINWFGFYVGGGRIVYRDAAMLDEVRINSAPPPFAIDGTVPTSVRKRQATNGDTEAVETPEEEPSVDGPAIRENLKETVFFYPDIRTDKDGGFTIKFKMNDALTKWKLRMFAHTKDLKTGYSEYEIVTRKELMITPNNPRFVRQGDEMVFKARVDNMSESDIKGTARLELLDAETMQVVTSNYLKGDTLVSFDIGEKGSTAVAWKLVFTDQTPALLIYRVYAKAGNYTDAEEGYLPVLVNRKLVTETLPLWVPAQGKKSFVLKSLASSASKPFKHVRLTIEATSNPVWLAIQSLSYLRSQDPENSIARTNALFANLLAAKIVADNPAIKRVFEVWKRSGTPMNKEALLSNLETKQDLKQVLFEETPWVLEAKSEAEQKRNLALLFDLNMLQQDKLNYIRLLRQIQNADGGFPWYPKGRSNRYITQNILETLGKLRALGVDLKNEQLENILRRAMRYVNREMIKSYEQLKKLAAQGKIMMEYNHLGANEIHYLYTLGFWEGMYEEKPIEEVHNYYLGQAKKYWKDRSGYLQGMIALILDRKDGHAVSVDILKALEESSIRDEELGMYWKSYHGYHWYEHPVETQALLIEAFTKIKVNPSIPDELKIWLLKHKQTRHWKTDKATVAAVYSLILDNPSTLSQGEPVQVIIGGVDVTPKKGSRDVQAGTGYFRKSWPGEQITPQMARVKLINPNKHIAWGGLYWQYLADLDKIEEMEQGPLKVSRTLFIVENTGKGEQMTPIAGHEELHPGDLVRVRIRIQSDREMEFIHLSDQRAACLEPIEQISGYAWKGGLGFYRSPKDTKTHFFIDFLPRGVFVFEYDLRVTQTGRFSNGIAELQSYYAPEFSSHSAGQHIEVR